MTMAAPLTLFKWSVRLVCRDPHAPLAAPIVKVATEDGLTEAEAVQRAVASAKRFLPLHDIKAVEAHRTL